MAKPKAPGPERAAGPGIPLFSTAPGASSLLLMHSRVKQKLGDGGEAISAKVCYQDPEFVELMVSGGIVALPLVVTATPGLDHARICELRCYGSQAAG